MRKRGRRFVFRVFGVFLERWVFTEKVQGQGWKDILLYFYILQMQIIRFREFKGFVQIIELISSRSGLGLDKSWRLGFWLERKKLGQGGEGFGSGINDWFGIGGVVWWYFRFGLDSLVKYIVVLRSFFFWYRWYCQGWERSLVFCIFSQGFGEFFKDGLFTGFYMKRFRSDVGVILQSNFFRLLGNFKDLGVIEKNRGKSFFGVLVFYFEIIVEVLRIYCFAFIWVLSR